MNLSVVVPAFNEEETIRKVVESINTKIKNHFNNYEIIIVDDGSFDCTKEIIENLSYIINNIKILNLKSNTGIGNATINGIKLAKFQNVLIIDSDGQYNINDIKYFLPFLNEYDLIIGKRLIRNDNLIRKIGSIFYNYIINFIWGFKTKDKFCGFKIINKEFLNINEINSKSSFYNIEIFHQLKEKKLKYISVPVNCYDRIYGISKGANLKSIKQNIIDLIYFSKKIDVIK